MYHLISVLINPHCDKLMLSVWKARTVAISVIFKLQKKKSVLYKIQFHSSAYRNSHSCLKLSRSIVYHYRPWISILVSHCRIPTITLVNIAQKWAHHKTAHALQIFISSNRISGRCIEYSRSSLYDLPLSAFSHIRFICLPPTPTSYEASSTDYWAI
jgi:hypothetical protein